MFDVITIGSATRDVYIKSKGLRVFKSPKFKTGAGECFPFGSKVEIDEIYHTTGGSSVNTAISFSRLGLKVAALAMVGNDPRGDSVAMALQEERVYTGFLQRDKRRLTAYSLIMLAPSGERTILIYRGAAEGIVGREIPWKKLNAKWFYIGHLAGKSKALFEPLIDFASKNNIRVAINPGLTQLKNSEKWWGRILDKVDILILNREEASCLTRVPYQDEHKLFEKLDKWVKGVVVITQGPKGVLVSDNKCRYKAGILKEKKLEDRTGAGDAFGAGFVAGIIKSQKHAPHRNKASGSGLKVKSMPRTETKFLVRGQNLIEYAIQLASANATSQIEKLGARNGLLHKNQSIYRWGKLVIHKERIPH